MRTYLLLAVQVSGAVRAMSEQFAKEHDLTVIEVEPNSRFSVGSLRFAPHADKRVKVRGVTFMTEQTKNERVLVGQVNMGVHSFVPVCVNEESLSHGQGPLIVEDFGRGKLVWRNLMYDGKQMRDSILR